MRKNALERYEAIKAMNTLVKCLNNEEAYYGHWIYIVPDEASDEELMEIASEDYQEDTFKEASILFLQLMNEYGSDGLYIDNMLFCAGGM